MQSLVRALHSRRAWTMLVLLACLYRAKFPGHGIAFFFNSYGVLEQGRYLPCRSVGARRKKAEANTGIIFKIRKSLTRLPWPGRLCMSSHLPTMCKASIRTPRPSHGCVSCKTSIAGLDSHNRTSTGSGRFLQPNRRSGILYASCLQTK